MNLPPSLPAARNARRRNGARILSILHSSPYWQELRVDHDTQAELTEENRVRVRLRPNTLDRGGMIALEIT